MQQRKIRLSNVSGRKHIWRLAGGQTNPLVVAGLVALIIAGIVVSVLFLTRKSDPIANPLHDKKYWDEERGEAVALPVPESSQELVDGPIPMPRYGGSQKIIHPETKRVLIPMRRCPNPECKKYFVLKIHKNVRGMRLPHYNPSTMTDEECPHCHINLTEWYKEHGPR